MYQKLPKDKYGEEVNIIKCLTNGFYIPFDENNMHYQEYLKWLAEGNEPLPADE